MDYKEEKYYTVRYATGFNDPILEMPIKAFSEEHAMDIFECSYGCEGFLLIDIM